MDLKLVRRAMVCVPIMVVTACSQGGMSSTAALATAAAATPVSSAASAWTSTPASAPAAVSTVLSLNSATYSSPSTAGTVTVTVNRSGGSDGAPSASGTIDRSGASGAVSVSYVTANGSAVAGADYTAAHGTLTWPSADMSAKSFAIPIGRPAAGKSFTVTIFGPSGAALGTLSKATVSVAANTGGAANSGSSAGSARPPGVATGPTSTGGTTTGGTTTGGTTTGGTTTGGTTKGGTTTGGTTTGGTTKGGTTTGGTTTGGTTTGGTATGSTALSVRVLGNHLIDANNATLQLRGVNASGLEFVAAQGWDAADPWGGVTPDFAAIKTWKSNTVRLPLNEASWLGYSCVDATGATRNPDPGHNYQATVKKAVADATAAGLYVIVDLHWTAPKNFCPLAQNPMADADNSINFWTSVAGTFKGYPNVLFELFNEPYLFWLTSTETDWKVLMQGGTETAYVTGSGNPYTVNYTWQVAGMQQMLNAVRATGATNVVLVAGVSWAQDLSQWVANKPTDPLQQTGAVWHAYPNSGTVGDPQAALPKFGAIGYTWTMSVLAAGYPVVATEFGDHDAPGTVGSPFVSNLLPWADAHGVSYTGWAWNPWADSDNVLIKDPAGTPTDGYGVYTKAHYICVSASGAACP